MVRKIWLGVISLFIAVACSVIINSLHLKLEAQVIATTVCGIGVAMLWIKNKERRN